MLGNQAPTVQLSRIMHPGPAIKHQRGAHLGGDCVRQRPRYLRGVNLAGCLCGRCHARRHACRHGRPRLLRHAWHGRWHARLRHASRHGWRHARHAAHWRLLSRRHHAGHGRLPRKHAWLLLHLLLGEARHGRPQACTGQQ